MRSERETAEALTSMSDATSDTDRSFAPSVPNAAE